MYNNNVVRPEPVLPSFEQATGNNSQYTTYPGPSVNTPLPGYAPPSYYPPVDKQNERVSFRAESTQIQIAAVVQDADSEGFTTGRSFTELYVRRDFVKKVYAILGVQLLATVAIVCLFTFVESIREAVRSRVYMVFIAAILVVIIYMTVALNKKLQRNYPQNVISICVMTLTMSLFAGSIASSFNTEAVVFAFVLCTGVCFLGSVLTWFSWFDILGFCGYLFLVIFLCIWFGIVSVFTYSQTWYIQVTYGFIGALLFTLFLAYDTNSVLTADDEEITSEDYVIACIKIYTDIIMIFILLLMSFGGTSCGG